MSLPSQIPQQSVPLGEAQPDGNVYLDINWYLFFYNIAQQLFATNSNGGGGNPIQPVDFIDMVDLDAMSSDVPQFGRQIASALALEAQDIDLVSADLQSLRRTIENVAALDAAERDMPVLAASVRDLANALVLATDSLLPDPIRVEPWSAPTLINSWVNFGSPYNPVGYYKDPYGIVRLRGVVKSGTIGQTIFTLPIGYRPVNSELVSTVSNSAFGFLIIDNSGNVNSVVGSNVAFSLDNITFRAA